MGISLVMGMLLNYLLVNLQYRQILPHTTEHELRGLPSDLQDVFNDISLQLFNTEDMKPSDELWTDVSEPRYSGNEFDEDIVWSKQSQSST